MVNGWVEACANGRLGGRGGFIHGVGMGGWVGGFFLLTMIAFTGGLCASIR